MALLFGVGPAVSHASYLKKTIEQEGLRVQFLIDPVTEQSAPARIHADQLIRIRMAVTRQADGHPLNNWNVGAWLDHAMSTASGAMPACGQRVAGYLGGDLLQRPLLDLTGYYVLTLDAEPSVSVLDPSVSFAGRTSLYSSLKLKGRGFDWIKTSDDAKLFVGLAEEPAVAIADLQTLQVLTHVPVPGLPTRLALAPDERLLWVGHIAAGKAGRQEGVSIIDTVTNQLVKSLPLPGGHHEFAFSEEGRYVYVTNRQAGSVTVVDATTFAIIRTMTVPGEPLSVMSIPSNSTVWVVDGKHGRVHRYAAQGQAIDSVALQPGIGPAKLSPDKRYVLIVNPSQHRVHVLNAGTGQPVHAITVSGQPYDVMFSDQYVYVRSLASEQVAMVSLAALDKPHPAPQYIPAGSGILAQTKEGLPIASTMGLTLNRSGAFLASPTERTVYHYMEGMNAPDSGLRTYGHTPMAALAIQRGLRQVGPGEYSAVVKLPSAGRMVLAIASDAPKIRECIGLHVDRAPVNELSELVAFEWLGDPVHRAVVGQPITMRVRRKDGPHSRARMGDVFELRVVPTRGGRSLRWPLKVDQNNAGQMVGEGTLSEPGGYYVHIGGSQAVEATFSTLIVEASTPNTDGNENYP
ncbi:YncE family protein [Candidatus Nitrospira nitrosa]|nr:YncE family protein [Candidatus Nitrospira nitrosa]